MRLSFSLLILLSSCGIVNSQTDGKKAEEPGGFQVEADPNDGSAGSFVTIPEGSTINTGALEIKADDSFEASEALGELGIVDESQSFSAPVSLSSSEDVSDQDVSAMTLSLPLSTQGLVEIDTTNLIVVFLVERADGTRFAGIIANKNIEFADSNASFKAKGFGTYQVISIPTVIEEDREEEATTITISNPSDLGFEGLSLDSQKSPVFKWKSPLEGVKQFEVAIGTAKGKQDVVDWQSVGTSLEATMTNASLNDCTRYFPSVRTIYEDGSVSETLESTSHFIIDGSPPQDVSGLSQDSLGHRTISPKFSWAASSDNCGIDRYQVQIGTTASGNDIVLETDSTSLNFEKTDLALSSGTDYFFSVRAIDVHGRHSAWVNAPSWQIFQTSDISNLVFDINARHLATVKDESGFDAANGSFSGIIQTVEDTSGNDHHFTQGTAASRPTFDASLAAISFDATDDFLETSDDSAINTSSFSEKTVAVRFETSSSIFATQVVYKQGASTNGISIAIKANSIWCSAWSSTGGWGHYFGTGISTNQIYTVHLTFNGSGIECYLDGVQFDSADSALAPLGLHSANVHMGSASDMPVKVDSGVANSGNAYFDGKILQVVQFNAHTSASEALELHRHMFYQ